MRVYDIRYEDDPNDSSIVQAQTLERAIALWQESRGVTDDPWSVSVLSDRHIIMSGVMPADLCATARRELLLDLILHTPRGAYGKTATDLSVSELILAALENTDRQKDAAKLLRITPRVINYHVKMNEWTKYQTHQRRNDG